MVLSLVPGSQQGDGCSMPQANLPSLARAEEQHMGSHSQRTKAPLIRTFWRDGQVKGHILLFALRSFVSCRGVTGDIDEKQKTRSKEASTA